MVGIEVLFEVLLGVGVVGMVLLPLVPEKRTNWVAVFSILAMFLPSTFLSVKAFTGGAIEVNLYLGAFLGDIPFKIDALSAWFILLVNIGMLWAAINAKKFLGKNGTKVRLHYVALIGLHQALLWVCTVQHGLVFLYAWEMMSLASALLLIYDLNQIKASRTVMHYLVQMHVSGVLLAVGFIWMYAQSGTFLFGGLGPFMASGNGVWPFLVFLVGFGLKAEFVPLHGKIPHVYEHTLPHVSAILSGIMVKMGLYGLFRVVMHLQSNWLLLGEIVLSLSIITALYGALNAAVHRHMSRMLAYCTIENVGLIGIGIGLGMIGVALSVPVIVFLGFGGALLQAFNHMLSKSLLFYSGGWACHQQNNYQIDRMGALAKQMPRTAFVFLVGAVAICGMPPFNGFVSEFLVFGGLVEGLKSTNIALASLLVMGVGAVALVGGLSLFTFAKNYGVAFLGQRRGSDAKQLSDASTGFMLTQYVAIAIMLSVALFPGFYLNGTLRVVGDMHLPVNIDDSLALPSFATTALGINVYLLAMVGVIALIWMLRRLATSNSPVAVNETWTCGYASPNAKMQYSGKSFSKPLGKIFSFVIVEHKCHLEPPQGQLVPPPRKYATIYRDFVEEKLLDVALQRLFNTANYLKFIQNGRTQSYVLYGIVFILAIFIVTLLNVMQ